MKSLQDSIVMSNQILNDSNKIEYVTKIYEMAKEKQRDSLHNPDFSRKRSISETRIRPNAGFVCSNRDQKEKEFSKENLSESLAYLKDLKNLNISSIGKSSKASDYSYVKIFTNNREAKLQ